MQNDPVIHHIEKHNQKTMCYECPWCGHCAVTLHRFEDHLKSHRGYDAQHFRNPDYLVTGLAPFRALLMCTTCDFRAYTVTMISKHTELEHAKKAVPPKVNPKGKHFPFADVQLCTQLERNDFKIQSLKDALALVNAQLDQRAREPEIQGVKHVVALRGDLLTHRAVAYAHVFVELFINTGDYVLLTDDSRIDVTVRSHHACPALVRHQTTIQSENPQQFMSAGLLHAARGTPVVWYVISLAKLPSPGRWKLLDASSRVISRVTVDCDRVLV